MLNRNSNISTKKLKASQGRKIQNGVQITSGTHGISMDHRKSEDYDEQICLMQFKKPSKSTINKNKENIDTNLPSKKVLHKTQSTKSLSRLKKSTIEVKSKIGHKKVDSARSSLSKRSRSQTYVGLKKQHIMRKSLSPKTSRPTTHRQTKQLLSQRQLKTTRNKETDRLKKKDMSINSFKNNHKKKKKIIISQINPILNDSSIDLAKQLQNITKNFCKTKKTSSKKLLLTTKGTKKVIISDISKHRHQNKDSPQYNHLLTQKYKKQKVSSQLKSFSRHKNSSKTKQYIAAIIIQRAFRKYKQIQHENQINKIILSIITIQRWWRNYLRVRNSSQLPMLVAQSSLVTIKDFSYQIQTKKNIKLNIQLIQDSKDENIKDRIKYLLQDSQSKSNKFMETKKFSFSPIKKVDKQQLPLKCFSSPKSENFVENLQNLQKFHKQKLVRSFNNQRQAIVKLWQEKLCSPRTQQGKLIQLDERLNKELLRFEIGIKQVLRGISLAKEDQNSQQFLKSPPKLLFAEPVFDHSDDSKNKRCANNDIKQISQMQIQLSFNKDDKDNKLTEFKFDSSMQAVKMYIDGLYEYLLSIPRWKEQFLILMNQYRGISMLDILSGLQDEQQQNPNSFKLPLYKQYQDTNITIISNDNIQQFNKIYCQQRANQSQLEIQDIGIYEYFHIQAIVDSLNQQLHLQRPLNSLTSVSSKNIFSQAQVHTIQKTFVKASQSVIQCTTVLCGFIDDNNQLQQQYLTNIQQQRLRQMIISSIKYQLQQCNMNSQIIEVSTLLAETVVIEIFEQLALELSGIKD